VAASHRVFDIASTSGDAYRSVGAPGQANTTPQTCIDHDDKRPFNTDADLGTRN